MKLSLRMAYKIKRILDRIANGIQGALIKVKQVHNHLLLGGNEKIRFIISSAFYMVPVLVNRFHQSASKRSMR